MVRNGLARRLILESLAETARNGCVGVKLL